MCLVSMSEMLAEAKKGGYAVGQFNLINLEFAQAIVQSAEEEQSPLIFGVGEMAIQYMGLDTVVAIARSLAKRSGVPIALHLDHGGSFDICMKCIRAGFSSVMFDGSRLPIEENIRLTQRIVEAAHAVGVSVEGELGQIGGTEDERHVRDEDTSITKAADAIDFWERTRVDAMAIAVGTAHGLYRQEPHVRCDVIREVAEAIEAPVVLHGGSGVPDAAIREAIAAGVGKINVNTENMAAFTGRVREFLQANDKEMDPRKYLGPAREAIREIVRHKILLFGSNGKA